MHILTIPIVYPNTYRPNHGVFFRDQVLALKKYGHQTGIIAPISISLSQVIQSRKIEIGLQIKEWEGIIEHTCQYPAVPRQYRLTQRINTLLGKQLFKKYIGEYGIPDIVHSHVYLSAEIANWIKHEYGVPHVHTEHSSAFIRDLISHWQDKLADRIFREADVNICVSEALADLIKERYAVRSVIIPNVVDTEFFTVNEQVKKPGKYRFLNVAHLEDNKNHTMLIKAFIKAFHAKDNVELIIAGDGPQYAALRSLIDNHNMQEKIVLYGEANRNQVRDLMQNSDAFVLSSKNETFGVVLIEAMSCGLPVVATKCGGPESIVRNDKTGLLCDCNADSLIHAMKCVYQKQYSNKEIRKYVKDNFSSEIIAEKLTSIYLDLQHGY